MGMEPRNSAAAPQNPPTSQTDSPSVSGGGALALPDLCGDLSMRIDRNGTWYYQGSPIGRHALVKLFSTVLRKDAEGLFWLTTPVENGRIEVEDAPFIGVALRVEGEGHNQVLIVRTNVDDEVPIDAAHPLRVVTEGTNGEPRPYVHVRKGLEARLSRPVFYELVERGEEGGPDGTFGIWSSGHFFSLGTLA
jgi:hypothetical protein